ncbi:MAG: methyltransferase domain-containing protein [Vicinamibacterales bacterium]
MLIKDTQDYERGGTQKDVYGDDEVVTVPCPLCGSDRRRRVYSEHGAVGVSQCEDCSLIYTSPRIKAPEEVYWGNADTYYSEARLVFERGAAHHRDPNYLEELRLIRRYKPAGRFLDVGCNMGMLLRHVKTMGWEGVGVEPSPALASLAVKHGLPIHNCFLHDVPASEEGSFDVIALSDVFEHIVEPQAFLQTALRFLKPDGVIYIKVPNARWNLFKQGMLARAGRRPSQGVWDSYEHVVHYTDPTLRAMLEKAGLRVRHLGIGKAIQTPIWHEVVGHYYQYPTPMLMDWRRQLGRSAFYWLSFPERWARLGSIGYFAPNIVAIAERARA